MQTVALKRDVQTTVLTNGINVITEPMMHMRSAAVGIWVGAGSRIEAPSDNGISHFTEHMLFKGTINRSAEQIAREADSIGGHFDAFTGKELVGYNIKVLGQQLDHGFDILSDLVLNPLFREEDIEKEKGVILEELKMDNDNPESMVHEIFMSHFFKRHALGRPILGTKRTIKGFDPARLRVHHGRIYAPQNLTITAAGNLAHEKLVDLVQSRFGELARGDYFPAIENPQTHAEIVLKNKRALHQVHLCIGVPCHPSPHPLRFACYLLSVALGGGMSSRLFQNIRERQGLAYSVFTELNLYRDSGCLGIYAGTSQATLAKVVSAIRQEMRNLKEAPVPPDELRRVKDHLKGSMLLSLESTGSRMSNLARQYLTFGRFFSLDEIMDSIEAVTADSIQSIANEFFQTEKIGATVLGRLDDFTLERNGLAC